MHYLSTYSLCLSPLSGYEFTIGLMNYQKSNVNLINVNNNYVRVLVLEFHFLLITNSYEISDYSDF